MRRRAALTGEKQKRDLPLRVDRKIIKVRTAELAALG
jgi:hypothetical protein